MNTYSHRPGGTANPSRAVAFKSGKICARSGIRYPARPAGAAKASNRDRSCAAEIQQTSPRTAGEWLESPRLHAVTSCVARRRSLPAEELPDLLQEVRIALWRAGIDQPINASWVFRTASHKTDDLAGRRRPYETNLDDVFPGNDGHERAELSHLISARAARLPARLQEVYSLRYRLGLTERAIAKRMGICRASVRHLDRRCLSFFREGPER